MKQLYTKIKHHAREKKNNYLLGLFSFAVLLAVFGGAFFITRGNDPHTSELAFTEHSNLGQSAGSVVPASCGSFDHGTTMTCGDGSVVSAECGTCPAPTCSDWGGYRVAGCPSGYSGSQTWWDQYTCSGPYGTANYSGSSLVSDNCVANAPVPDACDLADASTYFTDQCCTGAVSGYRCGTMVRTCANGGLSGPVSCPVCVWYSGQGCSSGSNSCGMTNSGSYDCVGNCSASTPPDWSCPVTPVDCVGSWVSTGVCSVSGACGQTGSISETYTVTTAQQGAGVACPFTNGTTRASATSCSTASCTTGTISAAPNPCLMSTGATTCDTDLTWSTTNPVGTSNVTKAGNVVVFTGNNGTSQSTTVSGLTPSTTFYLNNNAATLASVTVPVRCANGLYWNGASGCEACLYGGCTGTGGNATTPAGSLTCSNGASNVPTCKDKPVVTLTLNNSTNLFLSNYTGNNPTIRWNASSGTDPDTCTIPSGNWSNPAAFSSPFLGSGLTGVLPQGLSTYSYSCTNAGGNTLASANVTVCPSGTPVLTNGSGSCQGVPVAGLTITGNYTTSAVLHLSCTNSDSYVLTRNGTTFRSGVTGGGAFTTNVNLTGADAGTYHLVCSYTSFDGHIFSDANDRDIVYQTTMPDPIVTIKATPASIAKDSATVLTWTVMYPNSVQSPVRPACKLSATPVCTGTCTAAQLAASTTVNTILRTEMTDLNDPNGSRLINPDAVDRLPAVHAADDWRALGKKTINLDKSMDFILDCGATPNSNAKARVIVTSTNEG